MPEIITAVYENGVLRPVNSVTLTEGQTVRLKIVPEGSSSEEKNNIDQAFPNLIDTGVMNLPPKYGQIDPAELARREQVWREQISQMKPLSGKSLSETIIEDRGSW
jgi:predicted DNA-binding antitoxin AbrB/MazE fold protein